MRMTAQDEMVEARLLGFPVPLYARGAARHADLLREFALIATSGADEQDSVPDRLLQLITELRASYGTFAGPALDRVHEAMERGEERVDVTYVLPPAAREAAVELLRMLDEADAYCRSGDLLTLAPDEELVRFRHWYLGELIRQLGGGEAIPWDRFADDPVVLA
jgi:hypothetical protein